MGMYTWRDFHTDVADFKELDNVREMTSYAIQSQYAASARILALAAAYQKHICPQVDVDAFYDKMFNIYTAEGFGLDNWGQILQMDRTISDPDTKVTFTLEDEQYRALLLYKAMANISASDAATQNKLLGVLVGTGIGGFNAPAYVLEVDTMVIRWVFEQFLDDVQLAIFKVAGTLARGAGVGWELYAVDPNAVFGFDGQKLQPFNQAPFAPDNALVTHRGTNMMMVDPFSGEVVMPEVFEYAGSQEFLLSRNPKFIISVDVNNVTHLPETDYKLYGGNRIIIYTPDLIEGDTVKVTYSV